MKALTLALIGSLGMAVAACHVNVDDHCDEDEHDWDDDDDQPCETHIHQDTNTATGSGGNPAGAGGTASSAGSGGSSAGSGGETTGSSSSGGASGDGSGSTSTGAGGSGGSAGAGGEDPGGSTGEPCSDCAEHEPAACLWGSSSMEACCSLEVLADVAAEECDSYGLMLADFRLEESCAGGHRQVSYQCCLDDAQCAMETVTLESCIGDAALATMAEQICADGGRVVLDLSFADACAEGSHRSAAFACCPAE